MTNHGKLFGTAMAAVILAACGGGASGEQVQRIGSAGGSIELAQSGIRVEVPAGAVSSEMEFRVSEVERHGALRAVEVRADGRLEKEIRIRFQRPAGVAATAQLKVVRVEHGAEVELVPPMDDRGGQGEVEAGDDKGGQGEVEPGDDKGGQGEVEPGDDRGHGWDDSVAGATSDDGTFALEPGDDKGGAGEVEPGDDKGGAGETEPGDDKGVDAAPAPAPAPVPVDDKGGLR